MLRAHLVTPLAFALALALLAGAGCDAASSGTNDKAGGPEQSEGDATTNLGGGGSTTPGDGSHTSGEPGVTSDGSSGPAHDAGSPYPAADAMSAADASAADSGPVPPPEPGFLDEDGDGLDDVTGEPVSGDKYEAPGTNPFVLTESDPFSTFGADVDTASYDILRRDLGEYGVLPHPASVRLEEYVNFFEYDYLVPEWGAPIPFSLSVVAAKSPFAATTLLRVGIRAADPPPEEKKPANLIFLVDTSGSMSSSNKLPLVKVVLKEALQVLDPTDTVGIVTYSKEVTVLLPPTPVSEAATITPIIDALEAGGSTAGAAGIQTAYEEAHKGYIEEGINRVILCTDGDFNVGISSQEELIAFVEAKRKTGITMTALGFGKGNLNDAMMEAVTNAGNGVYAVIYSEDQAIAYANHQLIGTIHFVAKDLKIQVQFSPDDVYAYRLLGYENNAIADIDFTNDKVDAGEVGAGHRVTALYELVMQGEEIPAAEGAPEPSEGEPSEDYVETIAGDLCMVRVRWKDVDAGEEDPAHAAEHVLQAAYVYDDISEAHGDFQWAAAIAQFAEILKDSPYGDLANLDAITAFVEAHKGQDADRQEFAALLDLARELLEPM